jgi:YHS domain-containing protein
MTDLRTTSHDSTVKDVDPVCGMTVDVGNTRLVSAYRGESYWFCAEACRRAFEKNPDKYLAAKASKKKGWFGRFLERMAKVNEKEFGCSGPKCH